MLRVNIHEVVEIKAKKDHPEGVGICQDRIFAFFTENFGRCEWTGARMDLLLFEGLRFFNL